MQRRRIAYTLCLGLALMFVSSAALAQNQLTNLVSNHVGAARHTDPLLVNAWGLVHAPGSPWWVSDNNSGWETLYDGAGVQVQQLKVLVPTGEKTGRARRRGLCGAHRRAASFKCKDGRRSSCLPRSMARSAGGRRSRTSMRRSWR